MALSLSPARLLTGCTLAVSLFASMAVSAQTITFQQGVSGYTGNIDTNVRGAGSTEDNSALEELSVDFSDGGEPSQILLRFEGIVGSSAIPAGSVITSATLTVQTTSVGHGGSIHRMIQAWNDTDTWDSLVDGVQANDVEAATTFNAQVGNPTLDPLAEGTVVTDVTTDIQAWVNGTTNNGWAILPWTDGTNGWDFFSAEGFDITQRPLLTVNYTVVPAPSSAAIAVVGVLPGIALVLRRRRSR